MGWILFIMQEEGYREGEEDLEAVKKEVMSVKKEDRNAYLQKVYAAEQLPGPPPFSYKKPYPETSTFQYKTYKLHYQYRQNTKHPKAILILFHGMGGCSAHGAFFANSLCDNIRDLNVYAFDQMNFGRSEGPFRGHLESLEDSVRQGETFVEFLLGKFENRPKVFIGGSSFGGAICLKMSLVSPDKYAGVVLLAPAIKRGLNAYGFLPGLARVLACILPPVRLFRQSEFKMGTRYNNKQAMLADKYNYNDGIVPHTAVAVINAMDELCLVFSKITVPFIAFQGTGDKMVDLFGPLDLEEQSASRDKTTVYLRGMWHNTHSEQEIVTIASMAARWLEQRM